MSIESLQVSRASESSSITPSDQSPATPPAAGAVAMGLHVPCPVDASLAQTRSAGRRQDDRRMSLPSPVQVSTVEIENAHTPIPRGGFSGGSPTGEVSNTPGRKQRGRTHSGRCFVTLKRKGSTDIVRQTQARSRSAGSLGSFVCDGGTPGGFCGGSISGGEGDHNRDDNLEAEEPLCTAVGLPSPPSLRRASRSGSGSRGGRRGSGGPGAFASLEDAAHRIAVDPDTGHSYFVERSTVCDACTCCDDVCEVAWCNGCDDKRARLEESYGPLMLSTAEMEGVGAGGRNGGANTGDNNGGGGSGDGTGLKVAPALSRRYPRKSSYTLCEVRRRKLTGACWVVSQGSVYDVTAALADHPGGKRSVLRNAGGRDCAEDFFFHSKAAQKQWRRYRIGSLVPCRGSTVGEGDAGERSMRTGSDCVIC